MPAVTADAPNTRFLFPPTTDDSTGFGLPGVSLLRRKIRPTSVLSHNLLNPVAHNRVLFGDVVSPRGNAKIIAARVSPATLQYMSEISNNIVNEPYWGSVTHLVYRGMIVNKDGQLELGTADSVAIGSGIANRSKMHLSTVVELVERWGLKLVWGMQDYHENHRVRMMVRKDPKTFLRGLLGMIKSFEMCEIEIDAVIMSEILKAPNAVDLLGDSGCCVWLNIGPKGCIGDIQRVYSQCFDFLTTVVVKSFGYQSYADVITNHGGLYSLKPSNESALKHFKSRTESMDFPCVQILMEIDTAGVEYELNPANNDIAVGMRVISRKEIYGMMMYGELNMVCRYNTDDGWSSINIPGKNTQISYDSEMVVRKKLMHVKEKQMGGVVIGELQDDLFPTHRDSLLTEISALLG